METDEQPKDDATTTIKLKNGYVFQPYMSREAAELKMHIQTLAPAQKIAFFDKDSEEANAANGVTIRMYCSEVGGEPHALYADVTCKSAETREAIQPALERHTYKGWKL